MSIHSSLVAKAVSQKVSKKAVKVVSECVVCVEHLNKSTHKQVKCEFCEFVACRVCTEKHLLSRPAPQCMDCGKTWTRPHLARVMTVMFMTTEYKEHREKIAFDQERLLLPAAQERIMEMRANMRLAKLMTKPRINIYKREMSSLLDYINSCFKDTATVYRFPKKEIKL